MESPLCKSKELFCPPRTPLLSRGGKWRVPRAGDQPPPASFSPQSLELRNRAPGPRPCHHGQACAWSVPNPDGGLALSLTFGGGDTQTAALRGQNAAPSCPPSAPGLEALRKVRGRCGSGERDRKWGRPRRSVSGSDGRSPAITRPGMVPLNRKPRASERGASCGPRGRGASR